MGAEGNLVDEDIIPDHYYGGGKIPVFKPTMKQFESFKKFVDKINHYGMRSGIVKIIAPKEWLDMLPALDDKVKDIKIKNPIVQHINGNSGTFRQENVEKQRTYNLPEWRKLCEAVDHQPPAKRGERRLDSELKVFKKGNTTRLTSPVNVKDEDEDMEDLDDGSPPPKTDAHGRQPRKRATSSEVLTDSHGRQLRTKRRNTRRSGKDDDYVDDYVPHDSIWDGFDYRIQDAEEYTPERCEELEKAYWRSLTYNSPLYGADMPGSLFDDSTTSWNVAKLENLLDCLGQKLPGVNTAYLYLGMWKSTFAWHLEDVDLYSINYIHFGAPKQWYSISQEDASKFEQVMKNIWPQEARRCDQFLRHKTFLVSPSLLQQNGIRVNKLVHHQGEFVITFPYGYHSGYNLGYNCAESVNFATESWLDYGKIAKKCHCIDDAVWVDVEEIERRLRGEVTEDEYEYDDDEEMGDFDAGTGEVLTPPESVGAKPRKKRQKVAEDGSEPKKRIRRVNFKINVAAQRDHCILCPNVMPTEEMLPTDNGKKAHRLCAIYTPETYFVTDPITGKEAIHGIDGIPEARLQLKCMFCRVARRGACFQCTAKKCIRGYHATCAAAAGVLVEMRDGWVEDPTSGRYVKQPIIDFQCKYHRPKRDKNLDGEALEEDSAIQGFGRSLIKGDVIQMQFLRQEIFAGVVVENRLSEGMVLIDTLPKGGLMEVEWKWILATDSPGPEASPSKDVASATGKQPTFLKSVPEPNDPLCEGHSGFKWSEFVSEPIEKNPNQEPVKSEKNFWYYLGEQSTEAIAKYSSDLATRVHEHEAV
ncbi:JmjC domain, hydroxylase-domain-containing protein, partial [Tirmania nivea]